MSEILAWLKPGTRVKRYILLQLISIGLFIFCIESIFIKGISELQPKMLIIYIVLTSLSFFGIIFSFLLAQKNILTLTLKNISKRSKNSEIRNLIYSDPARKRGPKIVIIGGGSGLSNILKELKAYTANITAVIDVSESEELNNDYTRNAKVTPGDIRKCIAAMSISDSMVEKVLTHRVDSGIKKSHSIGSLIISSMIDVTGSFEEALDKIPELFNIEGKILPTTMDETVLCAGLENGEIVVGRNNISTRVEEIKSPVKQIFLKDGSVKVNPKVIDAIKSANVIILGPGTLYTTVISNLLIPEVSKTIVKSKAKKVFISNLMNCPGETDCYTLSKHVNEIERYLGKHVLDYVIANDGEITEEMVKDFNQGLSTQVTVDLENIQNRAISVYLEDFVMTAPSSIIHNSKRVCEIIMEIYRKKGIGKLNVASFKKKSMNKQNRNQSIKLSKLNKSKDNFNKKLREVQDINTSNYVNSMGKKTIDSITHKMPINNVVVKNERDNTNSENK